MVGEFSFTAIDSNLPNTKGARANHPYLTQRQRATGFTAYVEPLMSLPFAVGYHWWQYNDEPYLGRWPDGEDSNYGVVSQSDEPYTALVTEMMQTNARVPGLHAAGMPVPNWSDVQSGVVKILPLQYRS